MKLKLNFSKLFLNDLEQLFAWGGQSTGVSASASFPPKKSKDYFLGGDQGTVNEDSLFFAMARVWSSVILLS